MEESDNLFKKETNRNETLYETIMHRSGYRSCHSFSLASMSASLIETSRLKSGHRTCPEASVATLNRFWQSFRHAQIEQYLFSDATAFSSPEYRAIKPGAFFDVPRRPVYLDAPVKSRNLTADQRPFVMGFWVYVRETTAHGFQCTVIGKIEGASARVARPQIDFKNPRRPVAVGIHDRSAERNLALEKSPGFP